MLLRTLPKAANYNIDEHRHRFAVWAAARAIQSARVGGTTEQVCQAVEHGGLREVCGKDAELPLTSEAFDDWHKDCCQQIIRSEALPKNVRYGCAAKIVAIYLKTVVVIPRRVNRRFIAVIHPPIDSNLLRGVCEKHPDNPVLQCWRLKAWSKLEQNEYFELINNLRAHALHGRPFWKMEENWTPQ